MLRCFCFTSEDPSVISCLWVYVGCLATVLGAVEEGNTANRGGRIQHVSGCVSSARLLYHTLYSNESHLLWWKNEQNLTGIAKISHRHDKHERLFTQPYFKDTVWQVVNLLASFFAPFCIGYPHCFVVWPSWNMFILLHQILYLDASFFPTWTFNIDTLNEWTAAWLENN